ncbi:MULTISPECIES: MFS transporter [unclassified Luteococcus]|uniref:MFS transporter n=1 Tax=unclassified Luteococcus TaxID=2639923 RepID=UPI00313EF2C0
MTARGHRPGESSYRRTTVALFLAGLVTFATLYCTQPLLPTLGEVFRITPAQAALSVSASTITLGIALLFLGPISDAIGRTNVMMTSLFACSMVTVATALSPTWELLLALRLLLGACVAGLPAVAVAYLREEIDAGAAGRATGLYIGGTALGGMSGRLVSGALADLFGWRWAIGGVGLLALACAVVVRALLLPSRHFTPQPLHPSQLTAKTLALLRNPVQLALMTLSGCAMGAFVACFNAMGFRLEAAPYRLSVGLAGTVFLVYAFGSWSSARAGRAAETHGASTVAIGGLAIHLLGIAVSAAQPLWLVVLGLSLITIGFFAAHGVASGWVAANAVQHRLGTGQAASLYLFAYYLGSSLAGTVAGWAWSRWHWPGVTALTACLVGVALVAVIVTQCRPAGRHDSC